MLNIDGLFPEDPGPEDSYRYGTVTGMNPLRVRLDGDITAVDSTPATIVQVSLGDRVYVQLHMRKMIVLGRVSGGPAVQVLPNNANLNNYLTTGAFHQFLNADAATGDNYPPGDPAGLLEVVVGVPGSRVFQTYTVYNLTTGNTAAVWKRVLYNGNWLGWYPVAVLGAWQTPTLLNSWTHYESFAAPGYRLVGNDQVQLKGVLRNGTVGSGNSMFVLPVGCRPTKTILMAGWHSSGLVDVRVNSGGGVYVNAGSWSYVSLEGQSFTIE